MYWINGVPRKTISLNNRALHFGDGFFTTARFQNGKVDFLDWHMDRLIKSADQLMFENLNVDLLYKEILKSAICGVNGVIKIIIVRSHCSKVFGYRYQDGIKLLRIIRTSPLPKYYGQWYRSGVNLKISTIRLARNSYFAGIKHLNRLEQVMIATEIYKDKISDEALVLDTDDNIIECCAANIFWRQKYQVFTPSLYYAGVNGVIRQLVLQLLPLLGYSIKEVIVGLDHLKDIDEIFITNSLLPLASVNSINNCFYSDKTLFHLLCSRIVTK